jgi:hypothetical protein
MFARYFIELPLGADQVEEAILRDPQAWVPDVAERANRRGDTLLADIGFGEGHRVTRLVRIELGSPIHLSTKTVIPVRWTPTGGAGLFPTLDADLEIAALDPDHVQLAMNARYVPPMGRLGRAIDRAVLYRITEATLKDFLDRVGESVRRLASDSRAVPR